MGIEVTAMSTSFFCSLDGSRKLSDKGGGLGKATVHEDQARHSMEDKWRQRWEDRCLLGCSSNGSWAKSCVLILRRAPFRNVSCFGDDDKAE